MLYAYELSPLLDDQKVSDEQDVAENFESAGQVRVLKSKQQNCLVNSEFRRMKNCING